MRLPKGTNVNILTPEAQRVVTKANIMHEERMNKMRSMVDKLKRLGTIEFKK